jgi:hypothetical protein
MLRIDHSRKFGSQPRDVFGTPSMDYAIENHGIHKKYKLKHGGTVQYNANKVFSLAYRTMRYNTYDNPLCNTILQHEMAGIDI